MVYGREREDLNNDLDNADRDVREREEESSNGALIALLCHHSQLDRVTVSLFVLHFDRDIRQIPTTNLIMRRARLSTLNCALVAQSSFSLLLCLVLLEHAPPAVNFTMERLIQHPTAGAETNGLRHAVCCFHSTLQQITIFIFWGRCKI